MLNILLFGAGSIGGVYVYILQQAGAKVTAVCRTNYEAVNKDGFTLMSEKNGNQHYKPDWVMRTAEEAASGETTWDFVVICSKSFPGKKPSTADLIKPAVGPSTAIVLI
jgi:2-dehydropantoate 2-reductase